MTTFEGFSEAGLLYSTNIQLVEEMRKAYEADVALLVTALEAALAEKLAPNELKTTISGKSRYWYVGGERESETPQLWTMPMDPDFLDHEEMLVVCGIAKATPESISRLAAIGARLGAEPYGKPSKWYLFYRKVRLGVPNAVAEGAAVLAHDLLEARAAFLASR